MSAAQLNLLLSSGSSSIVFDARPVDAKVGTATAAKREPFFRHSLLKNAIVMKSAEGQSDLRTRLFLPFDSTRASRGGVSMTCGNSMSQQEIETFFDAKLDKSVIEGDLRKIEILARTPSFAPFLLRDAFERSGQKVGAQYFRVSETEVAELKSLLKAKLKPLAAMALPSAGSAVESTKLDMLVNKLWDLNDAEFLQPFAHALKIPDGETTDVLYAWIGVSYFNREFTKRQTVLRTFAEWLASKAALPQGTREDVVAQFEQDRKPVRDRIRGSWSAAGGIFDKFNSSYDRLIQHSDASLFVDYLKRARLDFHTLGAHLAFIEQSLCVFAAIQKEKSGSQLGADLLRDLAISMRSSSDSQRGQAAA